MPFPRVSVTLAAAAAVIAAVAFTPTTAIAAGPPSAATAYVSGVVTPEKGGSVTGFGITATFAPGAVNTDRLIVLGNWPNGLDVTPPAGTAVKTFGIQECNVDFTGCTSVSGNYPNSPAGTQKIHGQVVSYSSFQSLGTTPNNEGNTTFGTAQNKLVTITINTAADAVYVYNANNATTASAYPKLLPSSSDGTNLTFQTFQPIVWTLTSPSN